MIPRHLSTRLKIAATRYPVVTITGPRQSGKTTLIRNLFQHYDYVSLENPDDRAFAREDPRGFLGQYPSPVILDEVQRAPDLFSYIQGVVDDDDSAGRFVLSGSQNFQLMKQISQSLAGRTYVSHLLPFTVSELQQRSLRTDADLLQPLNNTRSTNTWPTNGVWQQIAHRGFYPRIHDQDLPAQEWLAQYSQTYLQRDVRELSQVGDLEAFRRFLQLCAGRAGQVLNLSSLGSDCGISHETARRWLSMLETSFVVFRLGPHQRNFNKRLTKAPKLYFVDTGLLCYLLQISSPDELARHSQRGMVFENLVIGELLKACYNDGRQPRLSFWRDHHGNEVDLLVEAPDGATIAVEIKSGETIAGDFFKGLNYWRKLAATNRHSLLVYGGERSATRGEHLVRAWRHWL